MICKGLFTPNALRWLELILEERFGQKFLLSEEGLYIILRLSGSEKEIKLGPIQQVFHESRSDFSCFKWKASNEGFNGAVEDELHAPSEEKLPEKLIEVNRSGAIVNYDILGLTYWMLTRLEEIGRKDLDEHQRFPATSSHAYNNTYLERPIVDEWLNILGQVMQRTWPNVVFKQHRFQLKVSHDVDRPARYAFIGSRLLLRSVVGDIVHRKNFSAAIKAPWIWMNSGNSINPKDPLNTFDWLMEQSEMNGLTSAFYFISGRTDKDKDALYDLDMPQIRNLMREIHSRGHEIGLHPSYNTYLKPEKIESEFKKLRTVCSEEDIRQSHWGGRMHYLRWNQEVTLRGWSDTGMSYDSTLGYADKPGFRCGTCYEYPAFDVLDNQELPLRIRPLIAMDSTIISQKYLGLGSTEKAFDKFKKLKTTCKKVDGLFTLLWHNSFFNCESDFQIYSRLLKS